jgi:hypothetical protein
MGFFGAMLAEAHAFAGNLDDCRRLRAVFEPVAGRHLSGGHVGMTYEGPIARVIGLLDSALGHHASAEARLREALAVAEDHGLRPWTAQCAYDLGLALARGPRAAAAADHFARAAALAEEIGMPGLAERAHARLRGDPRVPAKAPASIPSQAPAEARSFAVTCEGDMWRIGYAGRTVLVKDSRGLQLLARLAERRGEEIHVLALASDEAGASAPDASATGIDARAREQYKARLRALHAALAEAEAEGDAGRVDRLAREKSLLESELARAFGLGGRGRTGGSPSERARVNVQRRLKDAIARVAERDPAAGRFLEKSVRTGTYCCFLD